MVSSSNSALYWFIVVSLGKSLNPRLLPMGWAAPCMAANPIGV